MDADMDQCFHSANLPFQCDVCNKCFSRKVSLEHHMRGHTGERPYSCSFCPMRFRDATRRRVHERVHTGEKPYVCSYCVKQFSTSSHLKNHIRSHTGEKPYFCRFPECGKFFSTASSLSSHIRVHPPLLMPEISLETHDSASPLLSSRLTRGQYTFTNNSQFTSSNQLNHRAVPISPLKFKGLQMKSSKTFVQKSTNSSNTNSLDAETDTTLINQANGQSNDSFAEDNEVTMMTLPDVYIDFVDDEYNYDEEEAVPSRLFIGDEYNSNQVQNSNTKPGPEIGLKFTQPVGKMHPTTAANGIKLKSNSKVPIYSCETCGEIFESYSLMHKHVLVHDEKQYPCSVCGDCFNTVLELNNHREVHSAINKKFYCSFCNKPFSRRSDMNVHVAAHKAIQREQSPVRENGMNNKNQIESLNYPYEGYYEDQVDVRQTTSNKSSGYQQFACHYCPRIFETEHAIKAHLRKHITEALKQGKIGNQMDLSECRELVPPGEKKFACSMCPQKFRLHSTLVVHERRHRNQRPYACEYCKQKFISPTKLQMHLRLHTGEKPFKCKLCVQRFAFGSSLRKHMETQHKITYQIPSTNNTSISETEPADSEIQQIYLDDPLEFKPSPKDEEAQDVVIPPKSGKVARKVNLANDCHKFQDTNDDIEFIYSENENGSMDSQTIDDNFLEIKLEEGELDSAGTQFNCPYCPRICKQRTELKAHIRSHTGERPFGCDYCGKRFTQRGHLTMHIRIHTGEKPFKCPFCLREFNQHSNLKSHLEVHRKATVHTCVFCHVSFNSTGRLRAHMLSHSSDAAYLCELCNRSFSQQEDLDEHVITHSNDKPFSCGLCNKRFTRRTHLTLHERTHETKEEEFDTVQIQIPKKSKLTCCLCDINFQNVQQLRSHSMEHPESERISIFLGAGATHISNPS